MKQWECSSVTAYFRIGFVALSGIGMWQYLKILTLRSTSPSCLWSDELCFLLLWLSSKPPASLLVSPHKSEAVMSQNWYSWACYFRVSADPVFGVVWEVSSGFVTWLPCSVRAAGTEPWAHMFRWLSLCTQIKRVSAWQCFTATEHSWRCLFSSFCSLFLNSRISSCNNTWRTLGSCKTQMLSSVINFSYRRIWVLLLAA